MKQDWEHITINMQEIERYLGYRKIQPDDSVRSLIHECVQELEAACTPRSVQASYPILWGAEGADKAGSAAQRIFPDSSLLSLADNTAAAPLPEKNAADNVGVTPLNSKVAAPLSVKNAADNVGISPADSKIVAPLPAKNEADDVGISPADSKIVAPTRAQNAFGPDRTIRIAGMEIHSRSLTRNLKGCTQAVLFAATLGPGCDRLVRRAEITSMVKAAVLQSAGAAMIEAYADQANKEIIQRAKKQALYARPRFSPGYGDLPLALQKDFFRVLDITRTIGVSLSDTLLMTPTKSITAIIGLSPKETSCILEGCEICNLHHTCPYARDAENA